MIQVGRCCFRHAASEADFEAIHRLNYRTFVREVGQYPDDGAGRLVDKFHAKNHYCIALRGEVLVGMIGVHGQPPFSVASRLPDPAILTRPGSRPIEVRLLAVEPAARQGPIAFGLMALFYEYLHAHGFTDVYISGIADRLTLYEKLGFRALGPPVRSGAAEYVPMHVSRADLRAAVEQRHAQWRRHIERLAQSP